MSEHRSDIELQQHYRDTATGFTGAATSLHFYGHTVERVTLSGLDKNGAVAEQTFDAPRLEPTTPAPASNGALGFGANGG